MCFTNSMKVLTNNEIISLQRPIQHFCDCYLVSSIGALARSKNGKRILTKNIVHNDDGFRIRFQNVHSQKEDYFISKKNLEEHPTDRYEDTVISEFRNLNDEKREFFFSKVNPAKRSALLDEYYNELLEKFKPNPIINALEIAMDRIIKKYPDTKPLVSKLATFYGEERFEYNYPSNFLEMFTGKKPLILNERTVRMSLRKDKEKAIELFENIDKADDFSMVAGTGLFITPKKDLTSIHCYTVEGVNSENQYIQIFDCRKQESIKLTFDRAIRVLKFLTGYIN